MEHTQIFTANELEEYAKRRDSEAVIPELIWMLINESLSDLTACRVPYGDAVNKPGWDGVVETASGYRQFVPQGKSFWEIGTGNRPQDKATKDFGKRTRAMSLIERQAASYVFVTPRGSWQEPAQTKWKRRREKFGWLRVNILDGQQLADWAREFPVLGKWLLKKMGSLKSISGFSTPAEHWGNLKGLKIAGDPSLSSKVFLVGRDRACEELHRLFRGETKQLLLATESELDAEDFVAAFLESLDEETRSAFSNRCLFVQDVDAWLAFSHLRNSHVLVASPKLDLDSDEQLHLAAQRHGHAVVIPVSGTWAHGKESLVQLRSPSAPTLETTLRECGFEPARARELAGAGALSLAALKRYLRGLGELPPYATWENARVLAQAGLVGKWNGANPADRAAMEELLGKSYGEWIGGALDESMRPDTPLIQRNEIWRVISRGEAWSALGPRLTNDDLNRFQSLALKVLGELDPVFDLPKETRYSASVHGKVLLHSRAIRDGVAESLALLGSRPAALRSCTRGKAEATAGIVVRELLKNADWLTWASLNGQLPLLAEASPDEFLRAVESALLRPSESPFLGVFSQESSGVLGGGQYMSGLLWALESLAWSADYVVKVTVVLGDLAAIDPGGNWANRPANSLNHILLPWFPQTAAPVPTRIAAVEALIREQPVVGWKLLLSLLPTAHGVTSGTHKPSWRPFVPDSWKDGATNSEYWNQVSGYADLATRMAASDLGRLVELVDRLPDLPEPARTRVLAHLGSDAVANLSEDVRLPLWEALTDLAAKHRRFADTQWAMHSSVVTSIEKVAERIAPGSRALLNRRLFSERDFDLYEETGDYEEQRRRLEAKRKDAVRQLLDDLRIDGLLDFVQQVESPRKVGFSLGCISSPEVDAALLPAYLQSEDKAYSVFIDSFVSARQWTEGWAWVDLQLANEWSPDETLSFLTLLSFESETWKRVKLARGDIADAYWLKASVSPWALDVLQLIEASENLISHGRPNAAIACLAVLVHKKAGFPVALAIRALTDGLIVDQDPRYLDQHHVLEVIQWLQEQLPFDSEDLFRIEWSYLPLLERTLGLGATPRALEWRLANDPVFYCQLISAVFRSDKDADSARDVSDAEKRLAQNAYRLLHGWRTLPGLSDGVVFSGDAFSEWLSTVKRLSLESGHFRIAMSQFGHVLAHSPADPQGLWIHKSIASSLDARDAEDMRNGFTTGLFNLRGVHGYSAGAEERRIADDYRGKATELNNNGFHRLADSVRILAEGYARDADRLAESSPFDDL